MPKLKTRRAAAKRFQVTGSGKFVKQRSFHRHNLGKKTAKRLRNLRKDEVVAQVDSGRVRRMLPYS
ncbi:MAG: 50S ribosomal protein L35 [Firmicutes bacterium]|nr:50S ribosomal protein L35 [Bacillota bacterium]